MTESNVVTLSLPTRDGPSDTKGLHARIDAPSAVLHATLLQAACAVVDMRLGIGMPRTFSRSAIASPACATKFAALQLHSRRSQLDRSGAGLALSPRGRADLRYWDTTRSTCDLIGG